MKVYVLDGSEQGSTDLDSISRLLHTILLASGCQVETCITQRLSFPGCCGTFACWSNSPGMCRHPGESQTVAEKIIKSDLLILLTPLVFGGYSPELKQVLDRTIQNLAPFLTTYRGETHRQKRYVRYPALAAFGWLPEADTESKAIFHALFERNRLNLYPPRAACLVITGAPSDEELERQIRPLLAHVGVMA